MANNRGGRKVGEVMRKNRKKERTQRWSSGSLFSVPDRALINGYWAE
jgi:hypothetical protein